MFPCSNKLFTPESNNLIISPATPKSIQKEKRIRQLQNAPSLSLTIDFNNLDSAPSRKAKSKQVKRMDSTRKSLQLEFNNEIDAQVSDFDNFNPTYNEIYHENIDYLNTTLNIQNNLMNFSNQEKIQKIGQSMYEIFAKLFNERNPLIKNLFQSETSFIVLNNEFCFVQAIQLMAVEFQTISFGHILNMNIRDNILEVSSEISGYNFNNSISSYILSFGIIERIENQGRIINYLNYEELFDQYMIVKARIDN